jgi:arabinose-5-phosphate isomerase
MELTMSTRRIEKMQVSAVMMQLDQVAVIGKEVILKEALEGMGRTGLGIACIVDENKKLLAILTDGDIRRKLLKVQKPFSAFFVDDAIDHAIRNPVTILPQDSLDSAVDLMGRKKIWDLPVVDGGGQLVGLLHLHPAVRTLLDAAKDTQ